MSAKHGPRPRAGRVDERELLSRGDPVGPELGEGERERRRQGEGGRRHRDSIDAMAGAAPSALTMDVTSPRRLLLGAT